VWRRNLRSREADLHITDRTVLGDIETRKCGEFSFSSEKMVSSQLAIWGRIMQKKEVFAAGFP